MQEKKSLSPAQRTRAKRGLDSPNAVLRFSLHLHTRRLNRYRPPGTSISFQSAGGSGPVHTAGSAPEGQPVSPFSSVVERDTSNVEAIGSTPIGGTNTVLSCMPRTSQMYTDKSFFFVSWTLCYVGPPPQPLSCVKTGVELSDWARPRGGAEAGLLSDEIRRKDGGSGGKLLGCAILLFFFLFSGAEWL